MVDNKEAAIIVEHVTKKFEIRADRRGTLKERFVRGRSRGKVDFTAVDDVSFSIPRGATFGLIGHNGSGKSTMLKMLAGVYRPSSGRIKVAGKVDALLELGAGFHGELTGRENVYLNGAILGRTKQEIEESIDWIIDFADIGDFIDVPVKVYSSGMTVRLGFAAAVAAHPEILIVDEIIAVGDEDFQRKCFGHLNELRKTGTTIALVTHSLALAQDLCDEAVWLDHGRVVRTGQVNEVVSAYLLQVNEIEKKRLESDLTAAIDTSTSAEQVSMNMPENVRDNQGSGEVRRIKTEFLDAEGRPTSVLKPREPFGIRLYFRALKEINDVELGLAFVHDSGVTIAGPNSRASGKLYDFPVGDSSIIFHMNGCPLQQGNYWISTALLQGTDTLDYSDRQSLMVVRSDTPPEEPGAVIFQAQWGDIDTNDLSGGES